MLQQTQKPSLLSKELAHALTPYLERRQEQVVVMGLVPDGIAIAKGIAQRIGAWFDPMVVQGITLAALSPLVLGAVTTGGICILNEYAINELRVADDLLDLAEYQAEQTLHERVDTYRGQRPWPDLEGRIIIVVDAEVTHDIILRTAVAYLRQLHPVRIIIAIPKVPTWAWLDLKDIADDIVCLGMTCPHH